MTYPSLGCDKMKGNRNTYKVDVSVVDWSLLQADVEDDEDRMCQVAGKTNVGQRNPEAQ